MKPDFRHLEDLDVFRTLPLEQRNRLIDRFDIATVRGGERLLTEGDTADTLHIVVSGRFAVSRGDGAPLALLGRGEPVGEIAFFTGGTRTADVTATRDSEVLSIGRDAFEALADEYPVLWRSVVFALAERLERTTAGADRVAGAGSRPRTVVVCSAGEAQLPPDFARELGTAVEGLGCTVRVMDADAAKAAAGDIESPEMNRWLAEEEATHDLLIYIASPQPDAWAQKAVRQADVAVLVGAGGAGQLNRVERMVFDRLHPSDIRLAVVEGMPSDWLAQRSVGAQHRLDKVGIPGLARFLTGRARGLVLGGGGALCGAHVGVVFALHEAGIGFDSFGGTSAGAAIAGALAKDMNRAEIIEGTKDIFLTNRTLKKWTIPRHGLIDPTTADRMIRYHYGEGQIEDLPHPFFAIASDLSDNALHVMDRGPLWQAIRATCSIPVLLPPLIDAEGRILVDGGIMDNLPVDPMRAKKRGPNAAIVLGLGKWRRAAFAYEDYPSRKQLLAETVVPWNRRKRLKAPRIGQILTRTILLSSDAEAQDALHRTELVFEPPLPKGMGIMDWDRFEAHEQQCYDWARAEIERRMGEEPEVFAAFR